MDLSKAVPGTIATHLKQRYFDIVDKKRDLVPRVFVGGSNWSICRHVVRLPQFLYV